MLDSYRIIDLTHPLEKDMPTHRAMPSFGIEQWRTAERDGFNALLLHVATHHGTHMDAPRHFVTGTETSITDLFLDTFVGSGLVLHVEKGPDEGVTATDLRAAEERQGERISEGDMVFLHTGFHERFGSDPTTYGYHHAYLSGDAARWLVGRGAKLVGMDSTSFDRDGGEIPDGTPAHNALLGAGIPLVEELVNLGSISNKAFFVVLPLPVSGGDGSPCRAIAFLDEEVG